MEKLYAFISNSQKEQEMVPWNILQFLQKGMENYKLSLNYMARTCDSSHPTISRSSGSIQADQEYAFKIRRILRWNIIRFKMSNKTEYFMYPFQNTFALQPGPYFFLDFTPAHFQFASRENQQLKSQNAILQKQLEEARILHARILANKPSQDIFEEEEYQQQKRNYRKRREWLQKAFCCRINDCNKQYSSEMALRNHQRTKHAVRRRENKKQK